MKKKVQLPREIVVEKSGELKEAIIPYDTENGNPEPSPDRSGKVQRLERELVPWAKLRGSARHPPPGFLGRVMR
jgi:hypothetical protein